MVATGGLTVLLTRERASYYHYPLSLVLTSLSIAAVACSSRVLELKIGVFLFVLRTYVIEGPSPHFPPPTDFHPPSPLSYALSSLGSELVLQTVRSVMTLTCKGLYWFTS